MVSELVIKAFEIITLFGSIYFAIVVFAVLRLKKDKKLSLLFILSFILTSIVVYGLKFIFQVPRPHPTAQSPQPFYNTSFPSGHSARAFLYSVFLSEKFNKYSQILFYAFAVLTAAGRVLTEEHFPIDVVVGSIIGFGVGFLTLKYGDKILKFLKL